MKRKKERIKTLLILSICILASCYTVAQEPMIHEVKYPFVKYDLNKIDIPGDSSRWLNFSEKIRNHSDSLNGTLNIVQIGGSHVQADIWTGRVRENLNRMFNQTESCRGVIFPYRAVKTNGALQYDVTFNKNWEGFRNVRLLMPDNMGMLGWKATARDSGQYIDITLKGDTVSRFVFNRLRIFHEKSDSSFQFTVNINDSIYEPVYIDSCGCSEVNAPGKYNRFVLTVHKTDSLQQSFILHGIQTILDAPGVTYHSIGVNGASVGSYLNCNLFEHQLAWLRPDLIIFSIGINDSFGKEFTQEGFEASYSELIRRIRAVCPDVAFLFITNTDSYKKVRRHFHKNPKGKEVQKAMYNLAMQHSGVVWDLFATMGGYGSIATWKRNGLANRDLIHLTRKGYHLVGDLFYDAFIRSVQIQQNP